MGYFKKLDKHFVATGFVLNRDGTKMLMVYHRKLHKWAAPGGHIEINETPVDAVKREIFEETGISVKVTDCSSVELCPSSGSEFQLETPYMMLSELIPEHGTNKEHIHLDFIFLCEANDDSEIVRQDKEVESVKWMTWKEIESVETFESIKNFAKLMSNKR